MISPYVRRLRLASELRALRAGQGMTHDQLAKRIGQSRAQISRLENGHVVDLDDVMRILDALDVDGDQWTGVMKIAREAAERGWWESNKGMGDRQARSANFEAGAETIREFQMVFIPGLLQTDEFSDARIRFEDPGTEAYSASKATAAREGRQRMLRRPGGPTYAVIIDELAIRRMSVPFDAMQSQLYHLTSAVHNNKKIGLRVLPISAQITDYKVPRSAFSIYTFPEGDPTVVSVDTVTDDLVLTEPDQTRRYEEIFEELLRASLSQHESLSLLSRVANRTSAWNPPDRGNPRTDVPTA